MFILLKKLFILDFNPILVEKEKFIHLHLFIFLSLIISRILF